MHNMSQAHEHQIINNLIGTSGLEIDNFGTSNHSIFVETAGNTIRKNVIVSSGGDAIFLSGAKTPSAYSHPIFASIPTQRMVTEIFHSENHRRLSAATFSWPVRKKSGFCCAFPTTALRRI